MYTTINLLKDCHACHDGFRNISTFLGGPKSVLELKNEKLPLWIFYYSGGYSDMEWVVNNAMTIDLSDFDYFYDRSIPFMKKALHKETLSYIQALMNILQSKRHRVDLDLLRTLIFLGRDFGSLSIDGIHGFYLKLTQNWLPFGSYVSLIKNLKILFPDVDGRKSYIHSALELMKSNSIPEDNEDDYYERRRNRSNKSIEKEEKEDKKSEYYKLIRNYLNKPPIAPEIEKLNFEDCFLKCFKTDQFLKTWKYKNATTGTSSAEKLNKLVIIRTEESGFQRALFTTDNPILAMKLDSLISDFFNSNRPEAESEEISVPTRNRRITVRTRRRGR